jgi:hypothetical protein
VTLENANASFCPANPNFPLAMNMASAPYSNLKQIFAPAYARGKEIPHPRIVLNHQYTSHLYSFTKSYSGNSIEFGSISVIQMEDWNPDLHHRVSGGRLEGHLQINL